MLNDSLSEECLPHLHHLHSSSGSGGLPHHPVHQFGPTTTLLVRMDMNFVVTVVGRDGGEVKKRVRCLLGKYH